MFQGRLRVLEIIMLLLFGVALLRLADLQIFRRDEFLQRADLIGGRSRDLPALRGGIVDREGRLLAQDRCAYEVKVFPSRVRRRSLLYALRDLRVLLVDPEAPLEALLLLAEEPGDAVDRLLATPANGLDLERKRLRELFRPLDTTGGILVSWRHRDPRARVRELIEVLRGDGRGVSGTELGEISRDPRPLGTVLGIDRDSLLARLSGELDALDRLADELEINGLANMLSLLESLLEEERRWVDLNVEREYRQVVCLGETQSARFSPKSVGAERYLDAARRLRPEAEGNAAAAHWLQSVGAVLGGELPPARGEDDVPPADAVKRARSLGWCATDETSVTAAFVEDIERGNEKGRRAFLSEYREAQIRRKKVGGRAFPVGRGARPWILEAIEGPGRLRSIGFRVEAIFVRDRVLPAECASGRLLMGRVNSSGKALSGVEARLDAELRGEEGEVIRDREGGVLQSRLPRHGERRELTLDLELQKAVEGLLDRNGGIAVLDATNGEILALSTYPAPRPGELGSALAERLRLENQRAALKVGSDPWWELTSRLARLPAWHRAYEHPLHCPPGSIFKPLTCLAGLEQGVIDANTTFDCPPRRGRQRYGCKGHGEKDVIGTIKVSCNHFCYETALLMGVPPMVAMLERMGYFEPIPGLLGPDRFLKRALLADKDARSLSIGMGTQHASPVRAAGLMASLATGRRVVPTLVRKKGTSIGPAIAAPEHLELVRRGLEHVVEDGTARRVRSLRTLRAAGKTGTADFKRLGLNQAWFAMYAPAEAPRYAVAVMLEFTTLHGSDSAKVAGEVLEACAKVRGSWE